MVYTVYRLYIYIYIYESKDIHNIVGIMVDSLSTEHFQKRSPFRTLNSSAVVFAVNQGGDGQYLIKDRLGWRMIFTSPQRMTQQILSTDAQNISKYYTRSDICVFCKRKMTTSKKSPSGVSIRRIHSPEPGELPQ